MRRASLPAVLVAVLVTTLAVTLGLVLADPPADPTGPADTPAAGSATPTSAPAAPRPSGVPTAADLLGAADLRPLDRSGPWRVLSTSPNTSGDGLHSVCQQSRFADPRGLSAVVRRFAAGRPGRASDTAVQAVEVSRSRAEAARTFLTTRGWFAGCPAARVQLVDAHRLTGIGNRAVLLRLRLWRRPARSVSVAIARTGPVTTSTVAVTVGDPPDPGLLTRLLADAVNRVCTGRGVTGCVQQASYRPARLPLSGDRPGFLAAVDLPPVGRVHRPWVGTRVVPGAGRPVTSCDRADPARGALRSRSRTYLIPRSGLPARFGLGETVRVFATSRTAAAHLTAVRRSVAGCEDRDPATRVGRERRRTMTRAGQLDASSWGLTTRVSRRSTVGFGIGFVRVGRRVAQLVLTPEPGADLSRARFDALLVRAGERLRELG